MFADDFNVLMLNEPKVETSSDLFWKSSANFVNLRKSSKNVRKRSYGLRKTLGQSSEIFSVEIAQNANSCSKGKKLLEI